MNVHSVSLARSPEATAFGADPVMVAMPPSAEPIPMPSRKRIDSLFLSSPALEAIPRTTGMSKATVAVFDIHIDRTADTSMNDSSTFQTSPPKWDTMP